jgi:glyoxylase-like metal-dependent hydrolase (beta-lactamase superfamily II)
MLCSLQHLKVGLETTDIFITHAHVDHLELASELVRDKTRVFIGQAEIKTLEVWDDWDAMATYTGTHGFPVAELQPLLEGDSIYRLGRELLPQLSLVKDKALYVVGDYRFECLATPGHSPGHMCLYERSKKLLIAGDHILEDITPIITCWSDDTNPLQDYLCSLDKVNSLEVDLVLPAHRNLLDNPAERIAQIKLSHEERLREILSILKTTPMSAYELASKMTWSVKGSSWNQWPIIQRWFATSEALSHMRYLEEEGAVARKICGDTVFFLLNSLSSGAES